MSTTLTPNTKTTATVAAGTSHKGTPAVLTTLVWSVQGGPVPGLTLTPGPITVDPATGDQGATCEVHYAGGAGAASVEIDVTNTAPDGDVVTGSGLVSLNDTPPPPPADDDPVMLTVTFSPVVPA